MAVLLMMASHNAKVNASLIRCDVTCVSEQDDVNTRFIDLFVTIYVFPVRLKNLVRRWQLLLESRGTKVNVKSVVFLLHGSCAQ